MRCVLGKVDNIHSSNAEYQIKESKKDHAFHSPFSIKKLIKCMGFNRKPFVVVVVFREIHLIFIPFACLPFSPFPYTKNMYKQKQEQRQ